MIEKIKQYFKKIPEEQKVYCCECIYHWYGKYTCKHRCSHPVNLKIYKIKASYVYRETTGSEDIKYCSWRNFKNSCKDFKEAKDD